MNKIRVHLKERSYDILIGRGLLKDSGKLIKRLDIGSDAVCITNSGLLNLYKSPIERSFKKAGLTVRFELIPDSEKAKSARCAFDLTGRISAYDKSKKLFIVTLGGGVVGDLGGFVAAIYKRGVPYVQIPTTLLAQVESAIGGKVAIDLPCAKNLVGAFYQPKQVISDTSLLKTLPARQLKSGLGEVVKYGIIKDAGLFSFIEKNYKSILRQDGKALEYIIGTASRIKADIVRKDEFDRTDKRAILNYGHTMGHAIETASGYSGKYTHGEAIAIGMVIASKISLRLGIISIEDAFRIAALIKRLGLPTRPEELDFKAIYDAHLHDKKFIHGKNRFVLPVKIGRVRIVENVPDAIIRNVLKEELI